MTRRPGIRTLLALLIPTAIASGLLIATVRTASAHEFKLESLMNAFVKIESREAHLVIRLPLHVTQTVRFPVRGAEIDLANAGPALQRALGALSHDVSLLEDDRLLVPQNAIGRLSLPSDRSFQ